jgi:dTDP-4-dehydrorhamnose 3,5-epimerase
MNFIKTEIEGVYIIEPKIFADSRGYFFENFSQREFIKAVYGNIDNYNDSPFFVQENQSKSCYGVIRGLHYQKKPFEQSKLVYVVKGTVLDVAVDLRKDSPTFGKHVEVELSEDNHRQLFIPRGFAHGFSVLSKEAIFQYKCDNYYAPDYEGAVAWNDPDIGINWRIPESEIILSPKDAKVTATLKSL